MLTLPRYFGTVDNPTHTWGSTGGGDLIEPTELTMNHCTYYSLDECMLAAQICTSKKQWISILR